MKRLKTGYTFLSFPTTQCFDERVAASMFGVSGGREACHVRTKWSKKKPSHRTGIFSEHRWVCTQLGNRFFRATKHTASSMLLVFCDKFASSLLSRTKPLVSQQNFIITHALFTSVSSRKPTYIKMCCAQSSQTCVVWLLSKHDSEYFVQINWCCYLHNTENPRDHTHIGEASYNLHSNQKDNCMFIPPLMSSCPHSPQTRPSRDDQDEQQSPRTPLHIKPVLGNQKTCSKLCANRHSNTDQDDMTRKHTESRSPASRR